MLGAALLSTALSVASKALNHRHVRRHGHEVPPEFAESIDAGTLRRAAAYALDSGRLGLLATVVGRVATIAFLFSGLLVGYDAWVAGSFDSFIARGVLFVLGLVFAAGFLGLPFSLYSSFGVEARHGFNRTSGRLFAADLVKSLAVATVLTTLFTSATLALVQAFPEHWWWLVFVLYLGASLFLTVLSPYVIEPLFFKLEPLDSNELSSEIRGLCRSAGVRVERVLKMDASRRSAHSNAYFTGIGPVKRVVLFDTLLKQMTRPELLAVLAHELGHWREKHVFQRFVLSQVQALVLCYLGFRFIGWEGAPVLVGAEQLSFFGRALVFLFVSSLAFAVLSPLASYWSRRHEWEADAFAVELTRRPSALASALTKLARENLANLHPHPLYAALYASHPPMPERVRRLLERSRAEPEGEFRASAVG